MKLLSYISCSNRLNTHNLKEDMNLRNEVSSWPQFHYKYTTDRERERKRFLTNNINAIKLQNKMLVLKL